RSSFGASCLVFFGAFAALTMPQTGARFRCGGRTGTKKAPGVPGLQVGENNARGTTAWTKSLTRESRFDSRLQIRGGSLEPRRSDRGRVAYFAGVVAGWTEAWKARPRAPACGQSQHHQRHLMAASHRCTVARCAGKVWEMELSLSPLSALARLRCV